MTDRAWAGRGAARYKEFICKGAYWGVARPVMYPVRRRKVTLRVAEAVVV
ncbi:MAG: hypothetical protein HOW59_39680 [Nonomuraea sp.]|nr:hypothetical protein [Nonomuraea sp.]